MPVYTRGRRLRDDGVGIIEGGYIQPPRWASQHFMQSFNKIYALALTQFEKVGLLSVGYSRCVGYSQCVGYSRCVGYSQCGV